MTDRDLSNAARDLYDAVKHAGFNRASFTALGQAVASGYGWERLDATVKGPLMRIVLRLVPEAPDGTGPAESEAAETPAPTSAKPASASSNGTKPERA
jgi:hypothetical protein